jgi:hypothetical protein
MVAENSLSPWSSRDLLVVQAVYSFDFSNKKLYLLAVFTLSSYISKLVQTYKACMFLETVISWYLSTVTV